MEEKSKVNDSETDFSKLFESASDLEITEVLKKRKHYQKEAADAAVNEAIMRGIIHTEQDLLAEKYRVIPLKFSMFPKIENNVSRLKTIKSLTRSLLFLGAILMIWGVWQIFRHNLAEGVGFVLAGLTWNIISFTFFKSVKLINTNILFVLLAVAAVYATIKLATYKGIVFMDIFIVVVLFGFVLYGLLYLRKLKDKF